MNTFYFTQRLSTRILAAAALFSLIASLVPMQAFAVTTYLISGSLTQSGLQVNASGVASANTYTGQGTAQFISINWDFGGPNTAWVTLADHNTLNFVGGKGPNGVITNTNWASSHTYPAPGTYTIKALIHHSQPTGNEAGAQVFTQTVTITYQCSDGVDNDNPTDGLVDYPLDPGCTGPTDDNEFNAPVVMRTLTVNKVLPNDSGSTATADQFGFQVNGGPLTPFNSNGSNSVSLPEGTVFSVTEPAATGFTTTLSGCSGTLGSTGATCTITNNDNPATLTLVKQLANGGPAAATDWTLTADGAVTDISGVTGNAAVTNASVNAGTYTLSESTGPARYNAGDWVCTGVTNTGNQVTLANGQSATCTITNTYVPPRQASLTVLKNIINDNGGTAIVSTFQYWVNGTTQVFHNVAKMLDAVDPTLFTLTETNTAGYLASVWGQDCSTTGTVTLSEGQSATCTITNDDIQPKLTVTKVVDNGSGTGNSDVEDFKLFVGDTEVTSGVQNGFNAGMYILSETGPTGDYNASYSCSKNGGDAVAGNSLTLAVGDVASCTITNDDLDPTEAKITVNKIVVNEFNGEGVASDFSFTINGGEPIAFEEDGSNDIIVTTAGQYSIAETAAPGYEASAVGTCSNFAVALGQSYSCTITNTELSQCNDGIDNDEDGFTDYDNGEDSDVGCTSADDDTETDPVGSITIDKVVTGEGASDSEAFYFDYGWTTDLSPDATITGTGAPVVISNLAPGTYSITELALPARWNLAGISCVDTDANEPENVTVDGGLATISLSLGEDVKCTYTNNYTPRDSNDNEENIIVQKLVTLGSDTSKLFTFTPSWSLPNEQTTFQLSHGMTKDSGDLSSENTYSVVESDTSLWSKTSAVCTSNNSEREIVPSAIVLQDGETVTCVFTNNEDYVTLNILTSGNGDGVVTTSGESSGINCDSDAVEPDCSEVYPRNAVVDLTATPDSGSNFNNSWAVGAGTCTGNNTPCTVTMTSSISLNAHFDRNGGGGGGGTRVDRTPDGDVLGASDSPKPLVLGDQVSAVPAGAPNTGKGGTATVVLGQFLALPRRRNV